MTGRIPASAPTALAKANAAGLGRPSIQCRPVWKPQKSVRNDLTEIDFALEKGRHDPCAGVRAGITLESRMAIELMNAVLMHQAGHLDPDRFRLFTEGHGQ